MHRTASAFLSGILLLVAVGTACSNEEEAGTEERTTPTVDQVTDTPPPAEPTDTQPSPEPTDTPAPTEAPITYEIAGRQDVSFLGVVRIAYRVGVSGPLTEGDLRRIAQEIIDDETGQQDVNAIGFFFYLPSTDTASFYTAGKADWAPGGDWASADTVQAGDYSRHELGAIDINGP